MKKIAIMVSSGVIQLVYCSDPEFEVSVLDFDDYEQTAAAKHLFTLWVEAAKDLDIIYC